MGSLDLRERPFPSLFLPSRLRMLPLNIFSVLWTPPSLQEATARDGQTTRELMERKVQNMEDVDVVGTYHGGDNVKSSLEKRNGRGEGFDAV